MTMGIAERAPHDAAGTSRRGAFEQRVQDAFREFVGDASFPCLAAQGALHRGDLDVHVYGPLGSPAASEALAADLAGFARRGPQAGGLSAFVAVFTGRPPSGERAFEQRLWQQLQRLHDRDEPTAPWDPAVSPDPDDPRFSFSFAGTALFVVGLHPGSSRLARRFRWPALVFNPHAQFERLRRGGRFERLRGVIRERDVALQGSVNPNLSDFGTTSEAAQYSGRDTTKSAWRCPFHRRRP